jgi:alkanesulfonate monooxygenase SsuD/methylene tetrahydromethanopterin reductase-like flavin-dependent oxidoreductase (luciferase family)
VVLRLGYKASAEQFGPNELLDYSVLAETRGFDSVFISDHFQPWRHTGGHAPFSMAWMGALGARTSRILTGTSGKAPELYRDTLLPNVAAGIHASGRKLEDLDMMIEMKVSFDTDPRRALEDTRHWAALALSPEEKSSVEDPLEMERLADRLPAERAAKRWIVSTDPDEHVERIRPYVDMGFRHLVFHAPGADQPRFLNLYADQVLPRLRAAFG